MTWELNPNRTAQENLWDCVRLNVMAYRTKAVAHGLKLTYDEWEEVISEITIVAVRRFLTRLHKGLYDRNFSFFLNVRSCVRSVFYATVSLYIKKYVQPKMNSYDRLESTKIEHMVNRSRMPFYVEHKDERTRAIANLHTWLSGSEHAGHTLNEQISDYWDAVEAHIETGIPMDETSLDYLLGCRIATGQKVRVKMVLIREAITGNAVTGSLMVGSRKICYTLENKDHLLPEGEYKLSVSNSPTFGRDLPLIHNAKVKPNRGFRIHAGNRAEDSRGCVLVGESLVNGNTLTNSRKTEKIVTAIARNDCKLIITTNGML